MLTIPDTSRLAAVLKARHIAPCVVCRGTGFKCAGSDEIDDLSITPCACTERVRYQIGLRESRVPKEFHKLVSNLKPEMNQDRFARGQDYVNKIHDKRAQGEGFLCYGLNGAGKTMFGCYILASAIRSGYTAAYLTSKELATGAVQAKSDYIFREWFNSYLQRDFLCLDELGKEYRNGSEYSLSELDDLLRTRRGARLPTVICTNLNLRDFKDGYGVSVFSLIKDIMTLLAFEASKDFRDELKVRKNG